MKSLLSLLTILLVSCNLVIGQSLIHQQEVQLNAGLGVGGWGIPVYLGADYGVTDEISVGGEFSFVQFNEKFSGVKYKHSIIGLLVNVNYHFNTITDLPDPWDLYAGLNVGYFSSSSPSGYLGKSISGIGLGLQVGGRYYFSDNLGVNLELGGGSAVSGAKVGITIKI